MGNRKDISGKKFGKWTVLRISSKQYVDGSYYWWCKCECGKEKEVRGSNLRRGTATMCGFGCPAHTKEKRKVLFMKKVEKQENGCWIWKGYTNKGGYGKFGKNLTAHRYAYELFKGEIHDDLHVCHTCDVRNCVNPEHLWLGTMRDNNQDKVNKGRVPSGEKGSKAKLTKEQVLQIREKYDLNTYTYKELALIYGVSSPAIAAIIKKRTWKSL